MNDETTKKVPKPEDFAVAKAEHPDWDNLPTRKRNALARDQMFHREYAELSAAIMGFGKARREKQ